jgi:hypothetical protein
VLNVLPLHSADPAAEAERHAYNAAFEELGLSWHWDPGTFARLRGRGRERVRLYLEAEHAHLLRAYEADFLLEAIETARSRCQERAGREQPVLAHYASHSAIDSRQAA